MNRRNFLKSMFAGGLVMRSGSVLNGNTGITRDDLQSSKGEIETIPGLDNALVKILNHASLAPSAHNAQPWTVKIIDPFNWVIGLDRQRRLPVVDPSNRQALLALGAFIENLSLSAGASGFETKTEVIAKNPTEENIAKVSLKEGIISPYPLERIIKRRTIRTGYQNTEIRARDVGTLSEHSKGHLFYFPQGTKHAKCIQEGALEYFRIQSYRAEAQRELSEWMRLKTTEAKKYRSGLTPESLEITGFADWYVRTFMSKEDVLKESFIKRGIERTAKQVKEGGGWFVITSKGDSVSDLIETGRRFERMALTARELKMGIHPMTQFLEEKRGIEVIAGNHARSMIPQFILRVGYLSDYPDPVSLRRPVSWFIQGPHPRRSWPVRERQHAILMEDQQQ